MLPHLHTIQLNDEVVVGEYWPKKIYIWNLEDGERVLIILILIDFFCMLIDNILNWFTRFGTGNWILISPKFITTAGAFACGTDFFYPILQLQLKIQLIKTIVTVIIFISSNWRRKGK